MKKEKNKTCGICKPGEDKKKKKRADEARERGNDADGINARRKKEFGGHGAPG